MTISDVVIRVLQHQLMIMVNMIDGLQVKSVIWLLSNHLWYVMRPGQQWPFIAGLFVSMNIRTMDSDRSEITDLR